jgi:hypothetical protein
VASTVQKLKNKFCQNSFNVGKGKNFVFVQRSSFAGFDLR